MTSTYRTKYKLPTQNSEEPLFANCSKRLITK